MTWDEYTQTKLSEPTNITIRSNNMPIIAKKTGGDFEVLSPGTYRAICKGVFDLGRQKQTYNGETKYPHQVIIIFEVDDRMTRGEYSGKRFNISGWYTLSLHEKSNLRKHLEGWRGRQFTEHELQGFDLVNVIEKPCVISVVHNNNGRAIISSISSLMKNQEPITLEEPFGRDDNGNLVPPEWIQRIQAESIDLEEQQQQQQTAAQRYMNDPYKNEQQDDDDDIPF